jgi:flavin-dependent dehydrogenase
VPTADGIVRGRVGQEGRETSSPPAARRSERYVFDFGPFVIDGSPHPCDGITTAYAPRRTILDKLLVDAATAAGADVREGFTVDEIVSVDGTVTGIRGHGDEGAPFEASSRVVVGADGWNSIVARAVDAHRYHAKPVLENAFYSYWSGLPFDRFHIREDRGFAAIPTNDDLTLVLAGCPYREAGAFRRDIDGSYLATLELEPEMAKRIRSARREERIVGGGVPNFFRTPFGPGWALVGDAGYTKDPITAQGITDAFHSAEWCAGALHETLTGTRSYNEAMADYQQQRDAALPLYEYTTQLATLKPPPPDMQQLMSAIARSREGMDAFVSVTAGTLSPAQFFDRDNITSLLAAARSGPRPAASHPTNRTSTSTYLNEHSFGLGGVAPQMTTRATDSECDGRSPMAPFRRWLVQSCATARRADRQHRHAVLRELSTEDEGSLPPIRLVLPSAQWCVIWTSRPPRPSSRCRDAPCRSFSVRIACARGRSAGRPVELRSGVHRSCGWTVSTRSHIGCSSRDRSRHLCM